MLKRATMIGALVLATTATMASPARAVDPCRQAYENLREAEARLDRWQNQHCPDNGECGGSAAKFQELWLDYWQAKAAVDQACP